MNKPVVLTGLRANSELHLGNYLGAVLPLTRLQHLHEASHQLNFFVPDLHSITTETDYAGLQGRILSNLRWQIAAGLDITQPNTYIYRQSYVPAHSELQWILSCFTGYGELARMTQFKDKSHGSNTNVSAGLFNYPVLMAADILLYGAEWVPLGDDQQQHLELARDVAIRLNHKFGQQLFVVPRTWQQQLQFMRLDTGVRIRSLRDPARKMSKSVSDPAGTILLSDDPDQAAKRVMSATTDSEASVALDWDRQPGISNLLQISALLSEQPLTTVASQWQGSGNYGQLKLQVADQVRQFLQRIQSAYRDIDDSLVVTKLEQDEAVMRAAADERLDAMRQAVGLRATVRPNPKKP